MHLKHCPELPLPLARPDQCPLLPLVLFEPPICLAVTRADLLLDQEATRDLHQNCEYVPKEPVEQWPVYMITAFILPLEGVEVELLLPVAFIILEPKVEDK